MAPNMLAQAARFGEVFFVHLNYSDHVAENALIISTPFHMSGSPD